MADPVVSTAPDIRQLWTNYRGDPIAADSPLMNPKFLADPKTQAILLKWQNDPKGKQTIYKQDYQAQLAGLAKQMGLIPKGYNVNVTGGTLKKDTNPFLTTVLPLMAGVATAGLAGPAIAGALGGNAAVGGAAGGAAGAAGAAGGATTAGLASTIGSHLPAIVNAAGTIGSIASGAAKGRAAGRQAEAQTQATADQLALERSRQEQQQIDDAINNEIAQRKYQQQAKAVNEQRAIRGGLLQGAQDVTITPPSNIPMGQITGGLRPSSITNRADIGANMQRDAQLALLNGETMQPNKSATLPTLNPLPKASGLDTGLDWLGLIGSLVGSIPQSKAPVGLDPKVFTKDFPKSSYPLTNPYGPMTQFPEAYR